MTEQNTKKASLAELRAMKERGELYTDNAAPLGPELGDEFWKSAVLVEPKGTTSVHLKLDPEVFDFFKRQGKGHITRMQDVLKAYVRAHQKAE